MNQIDLRDRSAVITGGASNVGLATAERFLKSGARVMIWDQSDDLLKQAQDRLTRLGVVHTMSVDVASPTSVDRSTAETEVSLAGIDIIVNSAGISRPSAAIGGYSLDDWNDVIAVNLTGVFLCCRAVIPHMARRGYGRVIDVASAAGKEGNPQETAYSAAKAGVIALTKSLGKELGKTGVIVNAIAPGVLETPLRTSKVAPELVQRLLERTPLGRAGTKDEIASLICWMASNECSYTTGFTFDAPGGRTTY